MMMMTNDDYTMVEEVEEEKDEGDGDDEDDGDADDDVHIIMKEKRIKELTRESVEAVNINIVEPAKHVCF